ncbi:MAG: L,D-transpeptidase family protein [Chitinophagaceae bacterium]|nr:L,D-transpeptidase family protein [Chitinophagaceae bacterium]
MKKILTWAVGTVCSLMITAQITPEQLKQYITTSQAFKNSGLKNKESVALFYNTLNYKTAWIQKENKENLARLLAALLQAKAVGLEEQEYETEIIRACRTNTVTLANAGDSLDAELRITEAALHFYNDFIYGNTKPALSYYGLKYAPGCNNLPALLAGYVSSKSIHHLLNHLPHTLKEVAALEAKAGFFVSILKANGFKEVSITSSKITASNKALLIKLHQLGIVDSASKNLTDSLLKQKIKEAQLQFGLPADGVLRSATVKQLNIPVQARLQQVSLALNYYRWLQCLTQQQDVIVVNIPAAYLKVYSGNTVLLEMRMIVGKKSTPTPTLSGTVNEVVLYPYWHVPHSIAVKELAPMFKRNPALVDAGNYQLLNYAGKIVDPYSINWSSFSNGYFPYIIRQSTGCDNALGLLKLNFYNPFTVYLHDTPGKNLFKYNSRFFSHGCMRMQKPMELGHMVLNNNQIAIDTLEEKGCVRNEAPVIVPAAVHMPVIVWYNPAGIDSTGRVLFFDDVYEKFKWMK